MLLKDAGRAGRGQGGLYPGQGVIWRERQPGPTGLLWAGGRVSFAEVADGAPPAGAAADLEVPPGAQRP